MTRFIACLILGLVTLGTTHGEPEATGSTPAAAESFSPYVNVATGAITRPEGYRLHWVHLGSWFVRDDDHARGPGVHDVYAEPQAVRAFRKTGRWPDGAALVKEIRGIESGALTTGQARWAGNIGVWFVMIKDAQDRFPENPIWGEGWGWALYEAAAPDENVNEDWKQGDLSNCYACHLPAKPTDWVFLQGYPTLREGGSNGAESGR